MERKPLGSALDATLSPLSKSTSALFLRNLSQKKSE